MNSVTKKAFAKINFFLDIVGRRGDGYHDIISLMQTVDWYDIVKVSKSESSEIVIKTNSNVIPCNGQNIAYKAAKKYLNETGKCDGIVIEIDKNIPVAAGMAGGSADAAAVLLSLNELYENMLSKDNLLELGLSLGADVPFCMVGGTKLVKGIGDILLPYEDFPECILLCAKIGEGVSTPEAYKALDLRFDNFKDQKWHNEVFALLENGIMKKDPKKASEGFFNIFEPIVSEIKPSILRLKEMMYQYGAYSCMMSGSGPSIFGMFDSQRAAQMACDALLQNGAEAKVCHPVSLF